MNYNDDNDKPNTEQDSSGDNTSDNKPNTDVEAPPLSTFQKGDTEKRSKKKSS